MCLEVSPKAIHDYLGIDGTQIWFPPNKMRGIHIQEIQDYAMTLGHCFFPIEREPVIAPDYHTEPRQIFNESDFKFKRFNIHIRGRVCILISDTHACAWDGYKVYDPKGFIESFERYNFFEAWILASINANLLIEPIDKLNPYQ